VKQGAGRIGVLVSVGCVLLGSFAWRASRSEVESVVVRGSDPAPPQPAPLRRSPPLTAAVTAAGHRVADPAEQLLRELEPLAVGDKPAALARALAADAQLPAQGVMAEARRALIVTLMVDTQRMSEARERAHEFIRQYPDSQYSPLVKGVTGIHPRPRPSELRDARPLSR
jgi:hypothetical protein